MDCLRVVYPIFDVVHLYDQSSGHMKLRPDSLAVNHMNVLPGGVASSMRSTMVPEIGIYPSIYSIGEEQHTHFCETEDGPFWLTPEEKRSTKYNTITGGTSKKEMTKADLLIALGRYGYDTTKKRF